MTNYLSNIAARALNQAPTVRPRLRGRFDPGPPANDQAVDRLKFDLSESIASERPVENSLAATSRNQQKYEGPHANRTPNDENEPRPSSFAHRDEKNTSALLNDTLVAPPQTPAVQPVIAAPTGPATEPTQQVSGNALSPIASSVERDASPVRTEQRSALDLHPDQARPSDPREIKTIIVREERIIERSEQAREPGSQPAPAMPPSNQTRRRGTKPPPVVVQTRIAPLVGEDLDFSLSRPSPQPQPTVRVTIGRIEVRAVASSQPPAKPRATPPVMNLDDYLRRRNQGNSR